MTRLIWLRLCIIGALGAVLNGFVLGQTGASFNIESETKSKGDEQIVSDFVVSNSDPKTRELLHEHPDTTGANYVLSPDEKWIYDQAHYGHKMSGGQIFKHAEGLKFKPVQDQFDDAVWHFFAKQESLNQKDVPYFDSGEGIIDFVAWSPDSARLLLALRVGEIGGERTRGVYDWYFYFNTQTEKFEVTAYLRRLNKDAWKRWKNFDEKLVFPEALSAEPVNNLALASELKKRYEDADKRMNDSYRQTLAKIDKEQQTNLRDDQRHWLKNREAGAKLYKESGGGKSTPEQRYWQYMVDSTEAQSRHLDTDWKSQTE